jgi:hypothetical protein
MEILLHIPIYKWGVLMEMKWENTGWGELLHPPRAQSLLSKLGYKPLLRL